MAPAGPSAVVAVSRRRWIWAAGSMAVAAALVSVGIEWRSKRPAPASEGRLSDGNRASANREANAYYEKSLLFGGAGTNDVPQARRMIEQALALDPKFAAARVEYAFFHAVMILAGESSDPNLLYKAEEEVRRALQDDPGCGRAHSVLAMVYLLQGRKELMPGEIDKALKANPDDVTAHSWLLFYHHINGDYAPAIQVAKQTITRWPLYWPAHLNLGELLREQGDIAGAIREQERVLEQVPHNLGALAFLAHASMDSGDLPKARQTLARPAGEARDYGLRGHWALLLALEGKKTEAIREMDAEVQAWLGVSFLGPSLAAEFYAVVGETDKALEWLDRAVRMGDDREDWLRRDPLLARIRNQPRFQQMLASVAYRRKQRPAAGPQGR